MILLLSYIWRSLGSVTFLQLSKWVWSVLFFLYWSIIFSYQGPHACFEYWCIKVFFFNNQCPPATPLLLLSPSQSGLGRVFWMLSVVIYSSTYSNLASILIIPQKLPLPKSPVTYRDNFTCSSREIMS